MSINLLVSVIIPTYNRESVVTRAIDSVLNQTYKNWELLIVNDGSTDNTKETIRTKYAQEPRIKYIERPVLRPKGANTCRNIGIENAKGKYIALLDSDDEWKEQHLEKCYRFAEITTDFSASYTSALVKRGPFQIKRESRSINHGESFLDFLLSDGSAMTPTYFLKSKLAKEIKFDETLQRHQDWDFFVRFGNRFKWIFNPSMEVIVYRSLQNSSKDIDFDSCIKFYEKNEKLITQRHLKIKYLSSMYDKAIILNKSVEANFYKRKMQSFNHLKQQSSIKILINKLTSRLQQSYSFGFCKYLAKKIITEIRNI